jgi:hypothetical protein
MSRLWRDTCRSDRKQIYNEGAQRRVGDAGRQKDGCSGSKHAAVSRRTTFTAKGRQGRAGQSGGSAGRFRAVTLRVKRLCLRAAETLANERVPLCGASVNLSPSDVTRARTHPARSAALRLVSSPSHLFPSCCHVACPVSLYIFSFCLDPHISVFCSAFKKVVFLWPSL